MTTGHHVLLCFDGSDGARESIEAPGGLLGGGKGLVLDVVEPFSPAVLHGVAGDATNPSTGERRGQE